MRILSLLISLFSFSFAQAQALKLSGKVVNDKNEPLAGVSVKLDEGAGTATNVDGNFDLSLTPGKKYTLSFSAVGYAARTVPVDQGPYRISYK